MMKPFAVVVGFGILLVAGHADAQWKYTDDKGTTKVKQYKLDIPQRDRDTAVWAGPTGVGRPGLSEEQRQWKLRDDAYRRLGESGAASIKYRRAVWGAEGRSNAKMTPCTPTP